MEMLRRAAVYMIKTLVRRLDEICAVVIGFGTISIKLLEVLMTPSGQAVLEFLQLYITRVLIHVFCIIIASRDLASERHTSFCFQRKIALKYIFIILLAVFILLLRRVTTNTRAAFN